MNIIHANTDPRLQTAKSAAHFHVGGVVVIGNTFTDNPLGKSFHNLILSVIQLPDNLSLP